VFDGQYEYFKSTLHFLAEFNISKAMALKGLLPSNTVPIALADIDAALIAAYGHTAAFTCDAQQRIEVVTQCVGKDLLLRTCPATQKNKCPAFVFLPAFIPGKAPSPPRSPRMPNPPGVTTAVCEGFNQVKSGSVSPISASPSGTAFLYALPADCPAGCTVCSAGCLFCAPAWTGAGTPPPSLSPDLSNPGSWLGVATTAVGSAGACVPGMDIGAVTGSMVTVSGMTGSWSAATGTRVSSKTSACGVWEIV
jgi:hypothetical protein